MSKPAEEYLKKAVELLKQKKNVEVKINDAVWEDRGNKKVFKIEYEVDEDEEVTIRLNETIFKDYIRDYDTTIGIKSDMSMDIKIILRIAYLLLGHSKDYLRY